MATETKPRTVRPPHPPSVSTYRDTESPTARSKPRRPWLRYAAYLVLLTALIAGGAAAWQPVSKYLEQRSIPDWRTAEVVQGDVVSIVNATGSVKPVLQISIGAFVSGPIQKLHVEFNQEIKEGDLMAEIDPRIYQSNAARDKAMLENRKADLERTRAQLQQAINDEKRATNLRQENPAFISQAEIDRVHFAKEALKAQLDVSKTAVDQAQAQLDNSNLSLEYTKIRSPVDGIVINRKIDPGQTLAAQFQTPELFIVAPDMRKKMHVHASVDEADIGMIKTVQKLGLPVTFTVDAYPDDLFTGEIEEIRLSFTTTQNVVTYPVVVAAANPDLKLLPGMTANLSFEVARRESVTKIPNAALRYFPAPQHVRTEDLPLLEGEIPEEDRDPSQVQEIGLSAAERAEARQARKLRHVWVADGAKLRAVEVVMGLSESRFTELVSGDLKPGDKLVTGIEPPKPWGG